MTAHPTDADADADADDVSGLGYQEAVEELEAILAEIDDDAVDIDQLSVRVRRAAALVRLCQERIAGARLEVERVVADLALAAEPTTGPESAADGPTGADGPEPAPTDPA